MSSFSASSNKNDGDGGNPACFPVLDLFRRLASAGSLAMKQEKDHMMALVQSSKAGERLKIENWDSPFLRSSSSQEGEEVGETEIVFSSETHNTEQSGKEIVVEDDDETLDTSSGSSSSSSSSPSSPSVESSAETLSSSHDQQQISVQTPATQPQHHQVKPIIKKKSQRPPSVFGLDVVMESGLEDLEDELDEEEDDVSTTEPSDPEESSTPPPRGSAIRWSDDETNDPNAVNVTVHEVECIKDRTDMWWQGSEFVTIKQSVSETIRFCKAYNRDQVELLEDIMRYDCLDDEDLMKDLLQDLLSTCDSSSRNSSSSSSSSSESFTRGLEGHLSKMINKHRQRHTRKVLSAQEKFKKDYNNSATTSSFHSEETCERLREESLDKSQLLSAFARRMGQFDEMVVAKSLKARRSLWDI